MSKTPFPVDPSLVAVSIAHKNARMISDAVLPRTTVGKSEFKYRKHALGESFTVPNTLVGRKSKPQQVEFTSTEVAGFTKDYGLEDAIPQSDIIQAPEGHNPVARSVEELTSLIKLDREVRTAGLVFNTNSYATNNKATIGSSDRFSDPTSKPIELITDSLDSMIMRANKMVLGRRAFTALARHPEIVKAVHGNSGDAGIATRQQIAELFELEELLVGEGYLNTAKKGQDVNMQRVWGNHCALIHSDNLGGTSGNIPTFGFTAQFGGWMAGQIEDKDIGLSGGTRVRVGEKVSEVISAPDLGYFLQNVAD